jgi:ATP-dependent Lon protease
VKERVLEFLAVRALTKKGDSPILCLVGPPGTGKTSIARSLAKALKKEYVRISLGGVRDEAEIRGHRKTYIGAMPGRILYAMKNAGSINPVFLLDEIDKLSSDMRGDPASALLEVLDPEQNVTFRDRYLEVPFDLSKVMFITTANSVDTIPYPLLDRMEIIELTGYTNEEKLQIAKRYLIPKQLKLNGLKESKLEITDDGIAEIISGYTMEAGVRNLDREIASVVRKVAAKVAENARLRKQVVDKKTVEKYLGIRKHQRDITLDKDEVGACTGLAWTSVGGTTLTIEVGLMKGKGEIQLTGKLGDVMKESARAAISYLRSNAKRYEIDEAVFENCDIHVHVPEGATPKDGPSAGITMATAILSALINKPVKSSVAMTGEITLRGKVLAIGGLKEKALAAFRQGIKEVIIPKDNQKDLTEIPKEIRKEINFIPVSEVNEVFEKAIKF